MARRDGNREHEREYAVRYGHTLGAARVRPFERAHTDLSKEGPMTIWPLAFLGMLIALYALIIRVGIHRKPVLHKAKHSLRYWRNRLAHVAR